MNRTFMIVKIEIEPRGCSDNEYYHYSCTKFIGIYLRSQVSVYRTIGPLVIVSCNHIVILLFHYVTTN